MIVINRAAKLFALLALIVFSPLPASAQSYPSACSNNSQCGDGFTCQRGFFGLKWCLFEYCNADAECSRRGSLCTNGICRLPAATSGGSGGRGTGQSSQGGRCGPQRLGGGVIKSIGCQHGLQCVNGFCQRPAP